MEPVMEKIKDMVAQMPEEAQQVDAMLEKALPKETPSVVEFDTITSDFAEIPEFEPIEDAQKRDAEKEKKSLI